MNLDQEQGQYTCHKAEGQEPNFRIIYALSCPAVRHTQNGKKSQTGLLFYLN